MKRIYTWKGLLILAGICAFIALGCQLSGNAGAAGAFVVVGVAEILFGAVVIMIRKITTRNDAKVIVN
jgi:hypothetical protein